MFENLLSGGMDLGKQYLKQEIADHGKKDPEVRPNTQQVPAAVPVQTKPEADKKKFYMIGGGVVVGVIVLALVLKK